MKSLFNKDKLILSLICTFLVICALWYLFIVIFAGFILYLRFFKLGCGFDC